MNVQVVGCSYHDTPIGVRERLAFSPEQTREALDQLRRVFRHVEVVLLSTCNRVEVYTAAEGGELPSGEQIAEFLARFHGLEMDDVLPYLYQHASVDAVNHLFVVSCSLDSMVIGEDQILSQVKQAYQSAMDQDTTGPLTHNLFQAALHVARRVAAETAIHTHRVSVPSVAVADFAKQIFESFEDKRTLVIGAGEMGEETLRYLQDEGAHDITVVNRSPQRATELAERWHGRSRGWEELHQAVAEADLVISTTGAGEPVITLESFREIESQRRRRPLFILDLAVPRDFDPAIAERSDVYLYSVDDLQSACARNRAQRDEELPAAMGIVRQESSRFMADLHHRATGPVIEQLRRGWEKPKEEELSRLLNKLPDLDDHSREEVRRSFDRLVNKLLHPPLESLRDESRHGIPHTLLDALSRLFKLRD
jgi:glutamyl-tRNA reductase